MTQVWDLSGSQQRHEGPKKNFPGSEKFFAICVSELLCTRPLCETDSQKEVLLAQADARSEFLLTQTDARSEFLLKVLTQDASGTQQKQRWPSCLPR